MIVCGVLKSFSIFASLFRKTESSLQGKVLFIKGVIEIIF